ncbi:hypothetical protein Tco_1514690, partial [Tanacetum coccineum]
MVEEPVKTMKMKDLIRLDKETAKRLQSEFDEDERLTREKDEANVALIEKWDDIQAKIEVDHKLAQRLQAEEQEDLSVEDKAKLFQQILEQRRKYFVAKGRIVRIKSLLNAVSIIAALIDVNVAQSKLVLLENFNENYSKCLRLLYKVNAAEGVNVASEEVSTAEL